jgi:hypothetical protein
MIASFPSIKPTLDYYNVCRNAMRHIQARGGKNFGAYQLIFMHISDLCNLKPWGPKLNSSKLAYLSHEGATVKGELSRCTGYNPRSITTMLRGLEKMGVIRCTRQAGKELNIEMLMGFIGPRNRTIAADDKESEFAVDATRKPQHKERPARTRRQRDNAPTEVAEEPYRTIIEQLEATGFIRLRQRDIQQAAEVAPVNKLESEYLLAWIVEQLTERVRYPAEWLSARFREWREVGSDYVRERVEREQERKHKEFMAGILKLFDDVEVSFSEYEFELCSEGVDVPYNHPRFNEVARRVADNYKVEHGRPITMGTLLEALRVSNNQFDAQTLSSRIVPFDNPIWESDGGAVFLSDSEAASK